MLCADPAFVLLPKHLGLGVSLLAASKAWLAVLASPAHPRARSAAPASPGKAGVLLKAGAGRPGCGDAAESSTDMG